MTMTVKQHSLLTAGIEYLRKLSNELRAMADESPFKENDADDLKCVADGLVEHSDLLEEVLHA